ncbi:hypothetical protein HanRHA438_Chr09g0381761 [Helianthus annuus]|nr:hypothetical protein HanRHA438_Chr09g0381761 [Helianthus annuus]
MSSIYNLFLRIVPNELTLTRALRRDISKIDNEHWCKIFFKLSQFQTCIQSVSHNAIFFSKMHDILDL